MISPSIDHAVYFLFAAGNDIQSAGRNIKELACGTAIVITDVAQTTSPARLRFFSDRVMVHFDSHDNRPRTLFIYVDERPVLRITAGGQVDAVVPLSAKRHHKIVTGSAIGSEAVSADVVCT